MFPCAPATHAQTSDPAALHALLEGRLNDAIPSLERSIAQQPSPAAELLLCRALFSERLLEDALPHCQAAADAPNSESDAFLWLGRVQGNRARRANPLVAFAIARKVKVAFTRAVELDPSNDAAIDDLGQYLVEAPAIVGGGVDQARILALQSMAASPVSAHRILAMIAAKADDTAAAEREYRAAVASAHGPTLAGTEVELARFLQQHGNPTQALAAARSALNADHPPSAATVEVARLLTTMHAPTDQIIPLLQSYLASPARSDDAPAFRVHLQLARIFATCGDTSSAARERQQAQRLAPDARIPTDDGSGPAQVP